MHFRRIPFPRLSRGSETLIDQNDFKQQVCRITFQTNRNDLEAPWGGGDMSIMTNQIAYFTVYFNISRTIVLKSSMKPEGTIANF